MGERLLQQLHRQTRPAIDVELRDAKKRMMSAVLIVALFVWLGDTISAVSLVLVLPAAEGLMRVFDMLWRRNEEGGKPWLMAAIWLAKAASVGLYLVPSFALAATGSLPLMLAALVWWFCICAHITNVYSSMPQMLAVLLAPAVLGAVAIMGIIISQSEADSTVAQWGIMAATLVFYVFNMVETMHRQSESSRELLSAQVEANARLKALEHLSRHDSLTGLLNRRAFDEELAESLARCRRAADVAVMIVDLDGFKPINDTYSHEAGDLVLQEIGRRLLKMAADDAIVARLGGDEFAIAFRAVPSDKAALRLAHYIVRDIGRPIQFEQKELRVGASIGISLASFVGNSIETLCSSADQAMYRAKTTPGERAILHRPEKFGRRTTLEDRNVLAKALRSKEIRPFYQPKVRLSDGATIGFEALARWVHPVDGLRSPADFIPAINELGLQGDFLNHMALQVLHDVEAMLAEGLDPGQVSINVPEVALATQSGRQDLEDILDKYPDARRCITLEITEDVFIARASDMIRDSIDRFRRAGQRVSLDDFGTGFASFQHLRQLEFDELKIDTSFVRGLGEDKRNEVLVRGFLSMAQGLDVSVVAEGVETEFQAEMLMSMGCFKAQGFLFGKAVPFAETRLRLYAESTRDTVAPRRAQSRLRPAAISPPPAARGG